MKVIKTTVSDEETHTNAHHFQLASPAFSLPEIIPDFQRTSSVNDSQAIHFLSHFMLLKMHCYVELCLTICSLRDLQHNICLYFDPLGDRKVFLCVIREQYLIILNLRMLNFSLPEVGYGFSKAMKPNHLGFC